MRLKLTERDECRDVLNDLNEDQEDYGPGWRSGPDVANPYYSLDSRQVLRRNNDTPSSFSKVEIKIFIILAILHRSLMRLARSIFAA